MAAGIASTLRPATSAVRTSTSALPASLSLAHAIVVGMGDGAPATAEARSSLRVVAVDGDLLEVWDPLTGKAQASVAATVLLSGTRVAALLATPGVEHVITQLEDSNALTIWDTARGSLRTVAEHEQSINAVALAPKGDVLATAGEDGVARIWSVATGSLLDNLAAHDAPLTSVEFTADSSALIVGDRTGQVRIIPLALAGDAALALRGAAITAGGAAATVRFDQSWLELDWSGSAASVRWPLTEPLSKAAVSVDGSHIALLGADGRLRLFAGGVTPDSEPLAELDGRILDFALSETGKLLVAAGEDRQITMIGADGRVLASLTGHEAPVDRVVLSPDGTRLLSVDRSHVARIWSPGDAALLATFEIERDAAMLAVGDDLFVVVDSAGGGELWSLASRTEADPAPIAPVRVATLALGEGITAIALAPAGDQTEPFAQLAVARRWTNPSAVVELWARARYDEQGMEPVARFRATGPVRTLRFGVDAHSLAAIDGLGRSARWSTQAVAWIAEACASLAPGTVWPAVCELVER